MDQEIRALIAWLDREEAIATLLGHLPGKGEDTSATATFWERPRANLERREPYALPVPAVDPFPDELRESD